MNKKKIIMLIVMIIIAINMDGNVLENIGYEIVLVGLIEFVIKKLKSKKKEEPIKGYKYENIKNENNVIRNEIETKNSEEIDELVEYARKKNIERKQRVESYDYREFRGRNNVTWEEVYDYLWLQCRYLGYMMWSQYMDQLIKENIISEMDKKQILKKASNYIPFNERKDLQNEFEENKKKTWEESKHNKEWLYKKIKQVYMGMVQDRVITKEQAEEHINKNKPNYDDSYLKCFNYEMYLKQKGYV